MLLPTLMSLLLTYVIIHPGLPLLIALVMSTSETCRSLETSAKCDSLPQLHVNWRAGVNFKTLDLEFFFPPKTPYLTLLNHKCCCGTGRCIKCLHFGRCRACLVLFAVMTDKGRRHFCVEGIESIPKHPKREKVTLDLQPTRLSSKRQKLQDIESSPQGLKIK